MTATAFLEVVQGVLCRARGGGGGGVGWGDLLPDHDLHLSDKPAGSGLSIALKVSEYVWVFLPALSENQLMVSSFLQG